MDLGNPEKCRPFLSTGSEPVFEPFFSDVMLVYKTALKKSSKLLSFRDYSIEPVHRSALTKNRKSTEIFDLFCVFWEYSISINIPVRSGFLMFQSEISGFVTEFRKTSAPFLTKNEIHRQFCMKPGFLEENNSPVKFILFIQQFSAVINRKRPERSLRPFRSFLWSFTRLSIPPGSPSAGADEKDTPGSSPGHVSRVIIFK